MRMLSRSLALIWLIVCAPAFGGLNSWTPRGPYGGNTTAVAIHPTQPSIVLAQTWGGLYRSTDGGMTWSMPVRNNIGAVGSIVFDPTQPDRLFFGTEFVYTSTDAGLTFKTLPTPTTRYVNDMAIASDGSLYLVDQGAHVFRSDNHGTDWTEITGSWSGTQNTIVPQILVDPNEPSRVYVSVSGLGLFHSENRGATWVAPTVTQPNSLIYSVAVKPGDPNRLMIGTYDGLYVSTDRGDTWTLKAGGPFQTYTYVAFDPASPTSAIAVTRDGTVKRSTDSGVTWAASSAELKVQFVNRGAFTPGTAGRLILGTTEGPMVTSDGGVTFAPQFTGIHAGVVSGFASARDGTLYSLQEYGPAGVFRRDGDTWAPLGNANLSAAIVPQATDIATAASDSSLIYVITTSNQFVRSADGGVTWAATGTEFTSSGAYPQHAVVDPNDAAVAYVATRYVGLWKTIDRGVTWSRIGASLPTYVDSVGIDPADTKVLYVGCTDNSGQLLGIYKSVDGGQKWDNLGTPHPGPIVGFSFHPTDKQTVYAYSGFDVLKTSDGGAHWAQVDFGSPTGVQITSKAVLFDAAIPSTLFIVGAPTVAGFLRSIDSGRTWETFPLSVPQGDFMFLDAAALDPSQPGRIHVGVHGLGIVDYDVAPDLEVSLIGFDSALPPLGSRAVRVRVANLSAFGSTASEVKVTLPSFLSATAPNVCSLADSVLRCSVPTLRAQSAQEIEFTITAGGTTTTGNVRAEVKGHEADGVATNNETVVTATVATSPTPSSGGSGGGGGGGGRFDWFTAAMLGFLLMARRATCKSLPS